MNWKETESSQSNQQKHQFKSYYCWGCKQRKSCRKLNSDYCCPCAYQNQQIIQAHRSYEEVLVSKQIEREKQLRQLQLLQSYSGCQECGSLVVDAYNLYEQSRLVCQPYLMSKEGETSSPISFWEQSKWFKKHWKIELAEWLDTYKNLPVNAGCARKWLKDKEHLNNCRCLEVEARESYLLASDLLRKQQAKLKECSCKESEKVRVENDDCAWCEKCEESIKAARKKRVIKNRNDPRFWGVNSSYKILCLECIGKEFYKEMEKWQQKKWREYIRRGYI